VKDQTQSAIRLLEALTERSKELTCLYAIEEILREPVAEIDQVCSSIIEAIPPGWQFPDICVAKITLEGQEYRSTDFEETSWKLCADIVQQEQVTGNIGVHYTREMPAADYGPFLKEEKKLIETIANRLAHFLTYRTMKQVLQEWRSARRDLSESGRGDWEAVLDLIRQTDNALFLRISNKMLNHLCWSGIEEAEVLRRASKDPGIARDRSQRDEPTRHRLSRSLDFSTELTERIFRISAAHLSDEEILSRIQMWIQEDKLGALLRVVRSHLPLSEVASNLRRYFFTTRDEAYSGYPLARGLKVLLIECILSARMDYINIATDHVDIDDLYHLLQNVVFSTESHGRLGAKSAGFFLASKILKGVNDGSGFRIPRTWYIASDLMLEFIHYNNMDEIIEQKYKDIERVRLEYSHVIDMFRQGVMPPDMANGLSMALDDLGDTPIVVRGSSLLEDRTGSGFVGKYKSVFLGNQGSREARLDDLKRAVAEVYASNFGPDPIEYRADGKLLEFSEQMGVMIQEVVGTRVGRYFLPAYSGVARSRHDFQWLPDVNGNGNVVHIIPGLGTRAVDPTGDEHPVLVIPGDASVQNDSMSEESIRHGPKRIDAINLETSDLETLEVTELMRDYGDAYPSLELIVSVCENGHLRAPSVEEGRPVFAQGNLVVTFDGLMRRSPFGAQIRTLLRTLEEGFGGSVEVEFASDGEHLHVLQCRPQSRARHPRPAPIPKEIEDHKLVFSANRYVPNGRVSNITHIVYLDPAAHGGLKDPTDREELAPAMERLNALLPKRQFLLMLPGRGTVPGDAGVDIRYGGFKNAAVLIELLTSESAGGVLSMGSRFLQVIAESDISYLPVFPRDEGICFNERFLLRSVNILPELLPEYASLADVIRVIDIPSATDGKVMHVRMNAELGEAVGFLQDPEDIKYPDEGETFEDGQTEDYWRWRHRMAEQIAWEMNPEEFGVAATYLFGSTKNGTAGPGSDVDLLIHFRGTESQRQGLVRWLEGWSLCLDEINYLRTGYRSGGLLDVHIVTDEDIARKTSYAVKINAVTDAARPLRMRTDDDGTRPVSGRHTHDSRMGANG
jgi:hypothetical protein